MASGDFLHGDVDLLLREYYVAAGAACAVSTNCEDVLQAARSTFLRLSTKRDDVALEVRLWVDGAEAPHSPWPNPYVRGLDHLVFIGVDARSSMLADLETKRVIGRFSSALAKDSAHCKNVIFPVLMSVLAGSLGLVELHASCVAMDGCSLLLMGPGRSGKSTMAMALTQAGFTFVSDDRIFCSVKDQKLCAYGLPRPLKLRQDAPIWFDHFLGQQPTAVQNGERVFHCEPNQILNRQPSPLSQPHMLLFLDRQQDSGFRVTQMDPIGARARIEVDLLPEDFIAIQAQQPVLDALLELPCWRVQYSEAPQLVAQEIVNAFPTHLKSSNSPIRCQSATT
jgi:hypothetical protein